MDMMRCFLSETGMPKHLWCELASESVFFKNRMPYSAFSYDTSHYRMFDKNTGLSFLRIIGFRPFVRVKDIVKSSIGEVGKESLWSLPCSGSTTYVVRCRACSTRMTPA